MQNDPLKAFGLRLVEIRHQKGLSQEKLALESGLARSYLSGVERGLRNISLINIHKLADTLGVNPATLLEPSNSQKNWKIQNKKTGSMPSFLDYQATIML